MIYLSVFDMHIIQQNRVLMKEFASSRETNWFQLFFIRICVIQAKFSFIDLSQTNHPQLIFTVY